VLQSRLHVPWILCTKTRMIKKLTILKAYLQQVP